MAENQRMRLDSRIVPVDLVRFASILLVAGLHFTGSWTGALSASSQILQRLFSNGAYGVSCFFVVSGFLITKMLVEQNPDLSRLNLRKFYIQRIGRLWPLLALHLLLGYYLSATAPPGGFTNHYFQRTNTFPDLWFWGSIVTFTFNWFWIESSRPAFYGIYWTILWSLAVEEQFYLFYPMTLRLLGKRRWVLAALGAVACLGPFFRLWTYLRDPDRIYPCHVSTPCSIDQIAWGALAFFAWEYRGRLPNWTALSSWFICACGGIMMGIVYFKTDYNNPFEWAFSATVLSLGTSTFLLGAMSLPAFQKDWVRGLSRPGTFSYGCYLLHPLVLFLGWGLFNRFNPWMALTLFFLALVGLGAVSYRLFERPLNQAIREKFIPK